MYASCVKHSRLLSEKASLGILMRKFNRQRQSDGGSRPRFERRDSGSRSSSRSRDSGSLELYDVVCAECGKRTQVPFKPRNGKPVLCRECFGGSDNSHDSERRERRPGTQPGDLSLIHAKLDKIMRALKIE